MATSEGGGVMCGIINCPNPPTVRPVLELNHHSVNGRAITFSPSAKPVHIVLSFGLCAACAKRATADDFINREGWSTIKADFERRGGRLPTRHLTKLKLIPYMEEPPIPNEPAEREPVFTYECGCGKTTVVPQRLDQQHLRCPYCTTPLNEPLKNEVTDVP